MRDKLIELIRESHCVDTWNHYTDDFKEPNPIYELTDAILEDGWIRLPCKVGDAVWFIDTRFNKKCVREGIIVNTKYVSYSTGKTRFFIEAEYEYIDPFYNDGRKTKSAIWGIYKEQWGSWFPVYLTKEEAEAALRKEDEGNDTQRVLAEVVCRK